MISTQTKFTKTLQEADDDLVCIVCGGKKISGLHDFSEYRIVRCNECELVFVDPLPDPDELERYADQAHHGVGMEETESYFSIRDIHDRTDPLIAYYHSVLDILERHTNERDLLDVGSGNGEFLAVAQMRGWNVLGIDVSEEAASKAKSQFNVDTLVGIFPCDELGDRKFSAITMIDLLEHVVDPVLAVNCAKHHLTANGVLYVNSPNHRSLLCMIADIAGHIPLAYIQSQLAKYYHYSHVTVLNPKSLTKIFQITEMQILEQGQNNPILGRFKLPLFLGLAIRLVLFLSKLVGKESRLWMLVKHKETTQPEAKGQYGV